MIIVSNNLGAGGAGGPAKWKRNGSGVWMPSRDDIHYFLGADPAEAQNKRNDDGAMAILKATPLSPDAGGALSNWKREFIWAKRVRKTNVREWSGLFHALHRRFNLSGICMDKGGGGGWIWPLLREREQVINGVTLQCRPIIARDDATAPDGYPILAMMLRKHLDELFPVETMKGDDNLIDSCHQMFVEEIEGGLICLPTPWNEREKEERERLTKEWTAEAVWALKVLSQGIDQLQAIQVKTKQDGTLLYTRNNARQYYSAKRKDIAYGMLMAYIAFRLWVKRMDDEWMGGGPSNASAGLGVVRG